MFAAIPLPFRLHTSWRGRAPGLSSAALAVALVSMVVAGLVELAYAANLITTATQLSVIGPAFAGLGAWLLAIDLAPADSAQSGRLRWIGAATGLGCAALLASIVVIGGSGGFANPQAVLANPLFVALVALGTLSFSVGYPIWAIWLGRRLLAEEA